MIQSHIKTICMDRYNFYSWKRYRLPCYFFKRAKLNTSLNGKYFLKISGQCGSNKCKNLFYPADKEPKKDCDLLMCKNC